MDGRRWAPRRSSRIVVGAALAAALLHLVLVEGWLRLEREAWVRDTRPPRLQAMYVRTLVAEPPPERAPAPIPELAALQPPAGLAWLPLPVLPPVALAPAAGHAVDAGDAADENDEDDAADTGRDDHGRDDAQDPSGSRSGGPTQADAGPAGGLAPAGATGPQAADALAQRSAAPPDDDAFGGGLAAGEATAAAAPLPSAPAAAETPAADAAGFDWPPSTRMRYLLAGHWRGPVEGSAQVEWLRDGAHYQVHLDIVIGPPFAPLITRQMSSDGSLGADGLTPHRYDEATRILWREPLRLTIAFEPGAVRLASGRRVARPAGVQDAASQLVQLSWRFMREPALLRPGNVISVPLALPRAVSDWVYDVREPETLVTPAGELQVLRLEPRRQPRAGGDLVAEMWFAPALQYLPVRVLIRHGDDSFVDLSLDRLPEQAAAEPAPAGAPPAARRRPRP